MAISNGRGLRPGGVVRALGRLSLLISFGFAAGLLIGVLLEEPELLAGHLRGEGESVALAVAEVADAETRSPLSKPADSPDGVDRKAVMQARASEKPERDLPIVAAAAKRPADSETDRLWAIQVGAFADEAAAARLVVALDGKGYPTELLPSTEDVQRWRVRVQPVRGKTNAQEMAGRLKRVERLPTWVVPMEGRPR